MTETVARSAASHPRKLWCSAQHAPSCIVAVVDSAGVVIGVLPGGAEAQAFLRGGCA